VYVARGSVGRRLDVSKAEPLTFDELRETVNRYSYKPGSRFAVIGVEGVYPLDPGHYSLVLCQEVRDARDPSGKRKAVVSASISISSDLIRRAPSGRRVMDVAMRQLVRKLENHESDEWLRFDGVPLTDPHPE